MEKREHGRYPDVTVVCGEPEFHKGKYLKALLNPTVLVEVLSPITEAHGRNIKVEEYRKAEEYRSIPSLKEYLLIAQSRYHVEHYVRRASNQWLLSEYNSPQNAIRLAVINCDLPLAEIYKMVPIEMAEPVECG